MTAALLGVALLARVGILVANSHLHLYNDPADYQRLAVSLVHGHGFGTTVVAPGGGPTAFRPPLWPLFLAGVYAIAGVHLMVARAAEVVLGVVTVALIGALAGRLWGRPASLVAMGLAAVYPPLLLSGASLLSESLSLPLMLGSLLAALAAGRSPRPLPWCVVAGVLCGLDVLCRPDSFALVAVAALLAIGPLRLRRAARRAVPSPVQPAVGSALRPAARPTVRVAVLAAVAVLTVVPWLVRDAVVMGQFIPVTTQGGLVASGTYNDTSAHDPVHPAAWRPANFVPEYRPLLRGTEVQEEAALRRASLHYIRLHPTYVLRVMGWNLLRLFDLTGLTNPRASWAAVGFGTGWAYTDPYGLAALAALFLAGWSRTCLRAKRLLLPLPPLAPKTFPLWLAPFLVILVTIPVLGESRLRLGVDPFLVLLAAGALVGRRRPAPAGT